MRAFIFILLSFCFGAIHAQTTDTLPFDIELSISLEEQLCYKHTQSYSTEEFDLDFFLVYDWPVQAELITTEAGTYHLKGEFTYLLGGPTVRFYPTLVVMAEPRFQETTQCKNQINTYFIDLQVLETQNGSSLKVRLPEIQLGKESYLKAFKQGSNFTFKPAHYSEGAGGEYLPKNLGKWYGLTND